MFRQKKRQKQIDGDGAARRGQIMIIMALAYLGLCFIIAFLGTNRKFGYWGYFFSSLFLTPVVGAIVLLGSDKRSETLKKCPKCAYPLDRADVRNV